MSDARAKVWHLWKLPALPALHHQVTAAAAQAAAALDASISTDVTSLERGELTAVVLYRLAEAKLFGGDPRAAEQALQAIGPATTDESPWRFAAGVRACRVALRRGQRELAQGALIRAAQTLPPRNPFDEVNAATLGSADHAWRCVVIELGIAIAELEIQQQYPDGAALDALRALLAAPTIHEQQDQVFTMRQLLTAAAFGDGDGNTAAILLRANIKLAHAVASVEDEVEARLALIGVLVEQGQPVHLAEATRHAQQARDAALTIMAMRPELHMASLVAQAGVFERSGRRAGALDRCIEVAAHAANHGDAMQYVAAVGMMAEMYARTGDIASAFRTLAESNHALSQATGSAAAPLFRPYLQRLQQQVGIERLRKVAADVQAANELLAID